MVTFAAPPKSSPTGAPDDATQLTPPSNTEMAQALRALSNAVIGATTNFLTTMEGTEPSIGITMLNRWTRAHFQLESLHGSTEILERSVDLRREIDRVFADGSETLQPQDRERIYEQARELLTLLENQQDIPSYQRVGGHFKLPRRDL